MQQTLPKSVTDFKGKYPTVWDAFATLGDRFHQAGPLDEKTRRLVKLGIALHTATKVRSTLPRGTHSGPASRSRRCFMWRSWRPPL